MTPTSTIQTSDITNKSSPAAPQYLQPHLQQENVVSQEINHASVDPTRTTETLVSNNVPQNVPPDNTHSDSGFHLSVSCLPKLSLPTFSDDPIMWQSFWDSFKTTIHTNQILQDVQKFNYLKARLHDDAARVIEGLPLTSANYAHSIIDLLAKRFGQQQKIVNAHMQHLLDLPKPE